MQRRRLLPMLLTLTLALAACGKAGGPGAQAPAGPGAQAPGGPGAPPPASPRTPAEQLPPRPFAGSPAPAWAGVDVRTGQPITARDVQGEVVLLNFWATWCAPCKVEMPHLQAEFARGGGKLRVVAIGADPDETREQLKSFADGLGLTFTVVWDGGKAALAYQTFGLPTSFFLDRRGIIRTRFTGVLNTSLIRQLVADAARY